MVGDVSSFWSFKTAFGRSKTVIDVEKVGSVPGNEELWLEMEVTWMRQFGNNCPMDVKNAPRGQNRALSTLPA